MKNQFLFEKIFTPSHISSLEGEELKSLTLIQDEFSDIVDVMRKNKYIDLKSINELATLFWRLVGNRICPVAISDVVPTLSFWCEIKPDKRCAFILLPEKWHDILIENPHYQMGAMIFAASHAKDYWNDKYLEGRQQVLDRAFSSEAELLHHFSKNVLGFKPNDYQKQIMDKYPKGMKSCEHHYVGKEFS